MEKIKFLKKAIFIIVGLFIAYIVFASVFFYINGYPFQNALYVLKWNLSEKSKFETGEFIIQVPKFSWIGQQENDGIMFYGVPHCTGEYCNETIVPFINLRNFYGDREINFLQNEGKICDKVFEKRQENIAGVVMTIFSCVGSCLKCSPTKIITYGSEGFYINAYNSTFKSQYDKFFQGVRLKK